MITLQQFAALRHGDIVKWFTGPTHFIFRTIIEGPADFDVPWDGRTTALCITFPIRRRSWTGRIHTTYGWNDCKDRVQATGKRFEGFLISPEEVEKLMASGFSPSEQLRRELDPQQPGSLCWNPLAWRPKICSREWRNGLKKTFKTLKSIGA